MDFGDWSGRYTHQGRVRKRPERVCGRHFVSGKPAQSWDKHNVDWIPTLNLGKKIYKEKNVEAAAERAVRA